MLLLYLDNASEYIQHSKKEWLKTRIESALFKPCTLVWSIHDQRMESNFQKREDQIDCLLQTRPIFVCGNNVLQRCD